MEIKEKVIEATIEEFNEKNFKFTMDDIAKKLGISKKTIYILFKNKDTLFFETINYCFESIKESERKIIEDPNMEIIDKIKKIIIVLPNRYKNIDWRQIYLMKEKHPKLYNKVINKIEDQWEPTIELLEKGIEENKIKPISIPILKAIVESTIEQFIGSRRLIDNNVKYEEALEEIIDILMNGIQVK